MCVDCRRPGVTGPRSARCNGCWARPHVCTQCGAEFVGNKNLCNQCRVAKDRDRRAENWRRWSEDTGWKVNNRWMHIERKYGLTREAFTALLDAQGGRCAVCRTDDPGGKGTWHVDHDHTCCPSQHTCGKCLRGLVCYSCNTAMGMLNDDPARLRACADYLDEHAARRVT